MGLHARTFPATAEGPGVWQLKEHPHLTWTPPPAAAKAAATAAKAAATPAAKAAPTAGSAPTAPAAAATSAPAASGALGLGKEAAGTQGVHR